MRGREVRCCWPTLCTSINTWALGLCRGGRQIGASRTRMEVLVGVNYSTFLHICWPAIRGTILLTAGLSWCRVLQNPDPCTVYSTLYIMLLTLCFICYKVRYTPDPCTVYVVLYVIFQTPCIAFTMLYVILLTPALNMHIVLLTPALLPLCCILYSWLHCICYIVLYIPDPCTV